MMGGSDRFMVERCSDGAWVIDLEDGTRSWTSTSEGVNKVCSPDGKCIQVS
jgi:hypothetical protein